MHYTVHNTISMYLRIYLLNDNSATSSNHAENQVSLVFNNDNFQSQKQFRSSKYFSIEGELSQKFLQKVGAVVNAIKKKSSIMNCLKILKCSNVRVH